MTRYQIIWNTVRRIPTGRVATYGQVADVAGMDGHARLVGYAMHALPSVAIDTSDTSSAHLKIEVMVEST